MPQDVFIPESSPEDALVEQLHTVTYVTADKDAFVQAFKVGYGLEWSGWMAPSTDTLEPPERLFWADWGQLGNVHVLQARRRREHPGSRDLHA